tara:strand:+ start:23 stop:619 length:597 start_codon:yes stop_codon:yes gene_type:complete
MKKIIFATSSASRKKMINDIGKIGIDFFFKPHKINEEEIKKKLLKKNIQTKKITKILAKKKSLSINNTKNIIVGTDTLVSVQGKTVDKAKNLKEAFKKIKMLSGKKHYIYTSIYMSKNKKKIWSHTEKTTVIVRKLKNKEIKTYINKNKKTVLKTAGCYQAEKTGPSIFLKITGDYYNVLGFPVLKFLSFLRSKRILF